VVFFNLLTVVVEVVDNMVHRPALLATLHVFMNVSWYAASLMVFVSILTAAADDDDDDDSVFSDLFSSF